MTKKLKIASVGMKDRDSVVLKQLLNIYNKQLENWEYVGNFPAQQVIETMGSQINADVKLVDTDSELGKRAWYFLQAMEEGNSLIELSDTFNRVNYLLVTKPLMLNIESLVCMLIEYGC